MLLQPLGNVACRIDGAQVHIGDDLVAHIIKGFYCQLKKSFGAAVFFGIGKELVHRTALYFRQYSKVLLDLCQSLLNDIRPDHEATFL